MAWTLPIRTILPGLHLTSRKIPRTEIPATGSVADQGNGSQGQSSSGHSAEGAVSEPQVTPAPAAQSVVELNPAKPSEPDSKPALETDSVLSSPLHWTPDPFAPPAEVPGPDSLRIVPADPVPADPPPPPGAVGAAIKGALSLGFGQKGPGMAGDGQDAPWSPGGMAGATVAKAASQHLPGGCGRHPPVGDLRLGHSTSREPLRATLLRHPASTRRRLRRS